MLAMQPIPAAQNHRAITDLTGQRFGRWTVLGFSGRLNHGLGWVCRCECGTERVVKGASLTQGASKSCGCWLREQAAATCVERNYKHGMSGTRFRDIYGAMKSRCLNSNVQFYAYYGGRGITVDPAWMTFEGFAADMYDSYLEHVTTHGYSDTTLDRIDPDGPYSAANCRWATKVEQANNKRNNTSVEYEGRTWTVAQLARRAGISQYTLWNRLFTYGWPLERAITEPVRRRRAN